jgi:hypothetical protein
MKRARTRPRLELIAPVVALVAIASTAATLSTTNAQTSSSLTNQLVSCQSPGRPKPAVVLVHGAWADAGRPS